MSNNPDFSKTEQWQIQTTLKERWPDIKIEAEAVEVELRLSLADRELTTCNAMYWKVNNSTFILAKTYQDKRRVEFRSQFFYRGHQQFGAKKEYDNLEECLTGLLQMHADYEAERSRK